MGEEGNGWTERDEKRQGRDRGGDELGAFIGLPPASELRVELLLWLKIRAL